MAPAPNCFLLSLLLLFFHARAAQQHHELHRPGRECRLERLSAIEPTHRIKSEGGLMETFDPNSEQLQCAGVTVLRITVEPKGLLLPSYPNAPDLAYIVQGRGILGAVLPGCPSTFGSSERDGSFQHQHQKVQPIRWGDVIALPAGVPRYYYNDGDSPLVAIVLFDSSNALNQLDLRLRRFFMAGSPQEEEQGGEREQRRRYAGNIFRGLRAATLADVYDVERETANKLRSENDERGTIVKVKDELKVILPPGGHESLQQAREGDNGFEETFCTQRLKENIEDPERTDLHVEQAGRISTVNSHNLHILRHLRLSAKRVHLYQNAFMTPHYNLNAHNVIYVTRGRARVQVADENGRTMYDGELREGQLFVVPQYFVTLKQAGNEGFDYIAFKTNDNAEIAPLAGRGSVLQGLPAEVIANAYKIARNDALEVKYSREDLHLFPSRSGAERRAFA